MCVGECMCVGVCVCVCVNPGNFGEKQWFLGQIRVLSFIITYIGE